MTLAYKVLGPLAAVAVAVLGAPSAAADPAPPSSVHEVVHSTAAAGEDPRDMLAYWTPERMAAAEPLGSLLDGVTRDLPLPASQVIAPQAAPRPDSTGTRWTAGGKVTRTTGRVFLTMDGRDFTCSASVVNAGNKDTVVTAGHCLKDGTGAWAKNWTFAPGYADGDSPYGRYPAREMLVAPEWSDQADDSFDFGFAVLGTDGGDHVQSRTGAQKIAFDRGQSDPVYAFGYPSTGRYNGRSLHYCSGSTRPDQGGTTANGMACTMTEGSSGGPWLSDFNTGNGTGTITSVVSFKYADDSRTQYGPRLGDEARDLYRRAASL
ncbi:trypsin-like serine peptidase [Nocardiopsis sediminis]|uniref:Trypsin-like serine peptidase n=1 Tax=Nocardiopsis sediminis TaxID=1778267 RepID=A0ABV8FTL1_9ACTN